MFEKKYKINFAFLNKIRQNVWISLYLWPLGCNERMDHQCNVANNSKVLCD